MYRKFLATLFLAIVESIFKNRKFLINSWIENNFIFLEFILSREYLTVSKFLYIFLCFLKIPIEK